MESDTVMHMTPARILIYLFICLFVCLLACFIDGETFMCFCVFVSKSLQLHFSPSSAFTLTEYSCTASIPAPQFQFGGHTGQTVSTVVLKKKSRH